MEVKPFVVGGAATLGLTVIVWLTSSLPLTAVLIPALGLALGISGWRLVRAGIRLSDEAEGVGWCRYVERNRHSVANLVKIEPDGSEHIILENEPIEMIRRVKRAMEEA